jgi:hypothetical protein
MLTKEAIVQAFEDKHNMYAFAGSCVNASYDASRWLMENYSIVRDSHNICTNGLLALSNMAPLIMVDDKQPDKKTKECTHIYELADGCVWQLREVINRKHVSGGVHTITQCKLVDKWVFIDWSLGQFKSLPEGAELLLYM